MLFRSRAFEGYNVEQKFERFMNFVRAEAATQRHGHVMMTMGGDFQYSNANQWFTQLDKLLRLINARANETGIRAFYSTPGCYLAALSSAQNLHLPTKQSGDFFPYAFPGNHSYWTGYFVSKPALKGLIRESSALLQLGRSFEVLASAMRSGNKEEQGNEKDNNDDVQDNGNKNAAGGLLMLEQALATHHDAVTGTSKENVTRDYTRRLLDAWDSAEALLNTSFWQIALSKSMKQSPSLVPPLRFCRLAHNRSSCPFTQRTANFSVTVFNGLSWAAESLLVRIPLYRQRAKVLDAQGREVPSAVIKTFLGGAEQQLKEVEPAPYQLQFQAQIPPLGFRTFFVITVAGSKRETRADTAVVAEHNGAPQQQNQHQFWHQNLPKLVRMLGAGNRRRLASVSTLAAEGAGTGALENFDGTTLLDDNVTTITNETVISNNFFRLTFDANGLLSTVQDRRQGRILRLRQQFHFYRGANNGTAAHPEQPSGAYIFRPNGSHPLDFPGPVQLQVLNTTVAQEVRQVVSPWLSQTIRLVPGRPLIEFEWLIGPLPKNKSALDSTEVISRYTLLDGLQTEESGGGGAGLFWTDANGRQMMERKRNDSAAKFYEGTEPVAANYYPVNSRIWVQDDKLRMTVLTDRSQGGTSLRDGQIELMLHRRCFWDDHFGVEEALDEPGEDGRGLIVHGRHWLLLSPPNSAEHRRLALELLHQSPPQTMGFASMDFVDANVSRYTAQFLTEYSAILSALPPNVQLFTLRTLDAKNILLRLEHFYQDSDNYPRPYDADPVEVDIHNLFRPFSVLSAEELALGANRPLANTSAAAAAPAFVGPIVKLTPMEIRTFRVRISR